MGFHNLLMESCFGQKAAFPDRGSQAVHIFVVKIPGNLSSASLLASKLRYENLLLFRNEYLGWRGIPNDAIITILPAMGRSMEMDIHLDKSRIPSVICNEAGGETSRHVET